jgi:diacylglycerol kinase
MEILNTALEKFTDLLKPRLHHYVSYIKDIMAGGVLITAIGALVGGGLLFYPYLVR